MSNDWDLAIPLDRADTEPLYLQLVKAIEEGIRKGRFKPGEPLPGTRALADRLGVNRNTTQAAYQELQAEGWVEVLPDNGTFIARKLPLELGHFVERLMAKAKEDRPQTATEVVEILKLLASEDIQTRKLG